MDRTVENLIYKGDYDKVPQHLERLKQENSPFADIYENIIHSLNGNFALALSKNNRTKKQVQGTNSLAEVYSCLLNGYALMRIGILDEAFAELDAADKVIQHLKEDQVSERRKNVYIIRVLRHKGEIYWYKGQTEKAIVNIQSSIDLAKKYNTQLELSEGYYFLGHIIGYSGKLAEAIKYQELSLAIREKIGNPLLIAISLNDLALWHVAIGEPQDASQFFIRSINLSQNLQNKFPYITALLEFGNIFVLQGDYVKAEELYEIAYNLSKKTGMEKYTAYALHLTAIVHRDKGRFSQAIDLFCDALIIRRKLVQLQGKVNDSIRMSNTLYQLINTCLLEDNLDKAKIYFDELNQITLKNKWIDFRKKLCEALILKNSSRIKDKVKAQSILSDLIKRDYEVSSNHISFAMINLVELLILEYELVNDDTILEEIDELLLEIGKFANKYGSYLLLTEVLILHARFALLKTEVDPIFELLDNALTIAETHDLQHTKGKIAIERDKILLFLKRWDEFSSPKKKASSRSEEDNLVYFKNYLDEVKRIINTK